MPGCDPGHTAYCDTTRRHSDGTAPRRAAARLLHAATGRIPGRLRKPRWLPRAEYLLAFSCCSLSAIGKDGEIMTVCNGIILRFSHGDEMTTLGQYCRIAQS